MNPHVHQALAQVRLMHRQLVEKQRFKGYSGRARAIAGCFALMGALGLVRFSVQSDLVSLEVWLSVAAASLAVNFGGTLAWFLQESHGDHDLRRLKPALEVMPALLVGGILTFTLFRDGQTAHLQPIWMLLFGVANLASRHSLPPAVSVIGIFYLTCGILLLVAGARFAFSNPWPMGLVFFVGEWLSGLILHFDGPERPDWLNFIGFASSRSSDDEAAD